LITQFGPIVRDLDAEERAFGSSLSEAFDRRSTADYSIVIQLTRAEAMKARDKARAFIAYCRKLQRNANS
jgi:uncharacterized protein (UPF0332 family)